nr:hypothetical protein [Tanacetum cinerariifolium]GEZ27046.1 hypothetical protein [Tanacetum cinerariifolium]GEZ27623.1 hypothetical protein [Tanacetum cinerariifolium]
VIFRIMLHGGYFMYWKAGLVVVGDDYILTSLFKGKFVPDFVCFVIIELEKIVGILDLAKAGGGNTGPVPKVIDNNDNVAYGDYKSASVYDEEPEYEEEYVSGDVRVNLVVRHSCLTPKVDGDDWLKHNIFQSTCTSLGKVCTFVYDSGSCNNLIAEEAVQKLGLKTENRPKLYKLQWLKKGREVTVSKHVRVSFLVGTTYKNNVWCDVVAMDACHLLLESHNDNFGPSCFHHVSFMFYLYQLKYNFQHKRPLIFDDDQFEDKLEMGDDFFVLIGKEVAPNSKIPEAMFPLLEEFSDVFPNDLPDAFPPLCDIQYHIDLEPGS